MKFKHLQKVNIVSGFFEGLTGVITDSRNSGMQEYFVETLSATISQSWVQPKRWIEEKDLKEIICKI